MKIIDIKMSKEAHDRKTFLVCRIMTDHGEFSVSHLWHNTNGLWASTDDERQPAEIAACLRAFAAAIDREDREDKDEQVAGLTSSSPQRS